ncbi:chemotaxis protein (plasmid) [Azospirillum baldaniorum]|uniref:PAS/PAC domain n=1 Tax=Azospirillum baldaniorum TaxID=1064539 RepID=A0A9P1K008_9PROT|nr:PAS domain-containing protein [Azospirillum baldaniorum]TWA77891.1 PAS domain S-box-containing protein [Azospirillum brasilense]AWJ93200.1 chemotaxis protein [Azospirillum baldaniorum]NUB09031.1 PAS domain-containing protein [Azospirillum baldaniorum]TWA56442.1 PAS domain S-box-containing protein [Azospirillum baldaniorum]CCD03011.1 PAS/PAC domain [Azospirillum baldaniorum]
MAERRFDRDEIIVSKTDPTGRIIYANEVFLRVAGYREREVIGRPHNIIRHPDMPHGVFRLLWQTIRRGRECFAYVLNRAANGDHYWVLAHITPTFGTDGTIISFHSNRRCPRPQAVAKIAALYAELRAAEAGREGPEAAETGYHTLVDRLHRAGVSYDEFVFAL